ncbi:MAG: Mut7-C RNAse domain-containing protein [Anaerolineae bacterium]|nr:Mut7-C RNAse domain-containing protein [Anaerolineae bacterium]
MLNWSCMENNEHLPRLIADAMLGKLARWLRVLGFDTLYMQGDDHNIAAHARAEDRILLTRDTELARRKGLRSILITSQVLSEQLAQVVHILGVTQPPTASRCMNCNGILKPISYEQARPLVPAYVARTQHHFQQCTNCQQVYWQGTHWGKIKELRESAFMVNKTH